MTGAPRHITSASNPHFRELLKLQQSSRERRKAGRSLLDGAHLVSAYLQHVGAPEELIVSADAMSHGEIAALVRRAGVEPLVLSEALFTALSPVTTPTGIMAVIRTPRPPALPAKPAACVMLEDIQDPGNLGSVLRSAAAAGIEEVYLSQHSVHAWSPRVLRAGMGAHFAVRVYEQVDLAALAARYPGRVLAAARDGAQSLYDAKLAGTVALLFGNEGAGLTPELKRCAHGTLRIPMPGAAESLNVAAAAAVCLFERVRQMTVGRKRDA